MTASGDTVCATETVALACLALSATLVAVILTAVKLVTFGAVNNPVLEMLPAPADHTTEVSLVPSTAAWNRRLAGLNNAAAR
jgi:hypothetical protein